MVINPARKPSVSRVLTTEEDTTELVKAVAVRPQPVSRRGGQVLWGVEGDCLIGLICRVQMRYEKARGGEMKMYTHDAIASLLAMKTLRRCRHKGTGRSDR